MKHVMVTGANGFVGKPLSIALGRAGYLVTGLVRRRGECADGVREWVFNGPNFAGLSRAWPQFRCDVVVHLAARVHVLDDSSVDPLFAYRATNVEGSLSIAEAATHAGVKRFVYVSSVKALGETEPGHPWKEVDVAVPTDPYGISKREAEEQLFKFGRETGLEVVVIRPPLVYGPGVRANFLQLMHAIWRGWPLPLAIASAPRSMIFVDNLVDALLRCVSHPAAPGKIFHVSDDQDLTVAELARMLGQQLHRPARLWPVPLGMLRTLGRLTARSAQISRLTEPLRMDTTYIRNELTWQPPHSVEEGLLETANWYRSVFEG